MVSRKKGLKTELVKRLKIMSKVKNFMQTKLPPPPDAAPAVPAIAPFVEDEPREMCCPDIR